MQLTEYIEKRAGRSVQSRRAAGSAGFIPGPGAAVAFHGSAVSPRSYAYPIAPSGSNSCVSSPMIAGAECLCAGGPGRAGRRRRDHPGGDPANGSGRGSMGPLSRGERGHGQPPGPRACSYRHECGAGARHGWSSLVVGFVGAAGEGPFRPGAGGPKHCTGHFRVAAGLAFLSQADSRCEWSWHHRGALTE